MNISSELGALRTWLTVLATRIVGRFDTEAEELIRALLPAGNHSAADRETIDRSVTIAQE